MIPARLAYMPMIPENPRTAARRVRNDFLCRRCHKRMRSPNTSRNPIVNPRIHCRGDDWEGPVTQYLLLPIFVSSVSNLYFLPVTSVSNCLWIACRIAFFFIRAR